MEKYKVLYKIGKKWIEYKSDKKTKDTPSVFIYENALKAKNLLNKLYGMKNVKIVNENFELEESSNSKFHDYLNNATVNLGFEETLLNLKDESKVDFSKTKFTISKNNNIYINIFDNNEKLVLNYHYGQLNSNGERKDEIFEDLNLVIEEIKNQEGMIFEFGILPNLQNIV